MQFSVPLLANNGLMSKAPDLCQLHGIIENDTNISILTKSL